MARLEISQFGAIDRLDLELPRVAILVGPNASGKTSVLHALAAVLDPVRPRTVGRIRNAKPLLPAFADRRRRAGASGSIRYREGAGSSELRWSGAEQPDWQRAGTTPAVALFGPERDHMLRTVPLRTTPFMDPSGEGLADAFASLSDAQKDGVLALVRSANPRVTGFSLDRVEVNETVLVEEQDGSEHTSRRKVGVGFTLRIQEGSTSLGSDQTSDGTLWATALGTLLQSSASAGDVVILVDDLDRDLHPRAQYEVARALRASVLEHPQLRLVATTHSPFLLNAFEPGEVFVMHRDDEGAVAARLLADHPEWEKRWKGQLEAGELWSWAQESWVHGAP